MKAKTTRKRVFKGDYGRAGLHIVGSALLAHEHLDDDVLVEVYNVRYNDRSARCGITLSSFSSAGVVPRIALTVGDEHQAAGFVQGVVDILDCVPVGLPVWGALLRGVPREYQVLAKQNRALV